MFLTRLGRQKCERGGYENGSSVVLVSGFSYEPVEYMIAGMYLALHRSAMSKSEVYSWRVSPELKERLEDAARAEEMSMAGLLEQIALEWLEDHAQVDEEEQRRLHEAARVCIGKLEGGDPLLAQQASQRFGEILWEEHERKQSR